MFRKKSQPRRDLSLLQKLFILSAIIVITDFLIGIFVRATTEPVDAMMFLDILWRVAAGQRVGIDFHSPFGIGPYLLGAPLWHWLGPHDFVLRIAISLVNLIICVCGCIVANQKLARRPNFALLFCVIVAFLVSAPAVAGDDTLTAFGASEYYNRDIISALAILFLQTFVGEPILSKKAIAIEVVLAACLLLIMFLTKISGFVLGVMILLAGCMLRGHTAHRLLNLCAVVLVFAAIIAIVFKASGLEFLPILKDYELAAQARVAFPLRELIKGAISLPLVSSALILLLFSISHNLESVRIELQRIILIIGTYIACQFALNMTNWGDPNMWLAPAAIISLAVCLGAKTAGGQAVRPESWWQKVAPSRLAEISAQTAIPYVIFVIVLVPAMVSSIVGTAFGALVSLGIDTPYTLTAGNGISISTTRPQPTAEVSRWNEAAVAISALKLGNEAIANLDIANPFSVLFLAPPPKGIQAVFDFTASVPRGTQLEWKDVIGDACVVTIPSQPVIPDVSVWLTDIVRSKLATDFKIVYQSASWKIYRRSKDCTRKLA